MPWRCVCLVKTRLKYATIYHIIILECAAMCRFAAYLGKEPIVLDQLLVKPEYSLVKQSRHARVGDHPVNADGFGVAWYDLSIAASPGIYRSTQPAWNDANLNSLASRIQSNCFMSHVRASTVGDVTTANCHPFSYGSYSFVHNGHIAHFNTIRRQLIKQLDDDLYDALKGRTDSEHLFFLIMQYLREEPDAGELGAIRRAFAQVEAWFEGKDDTHHAVLNIVLSDGKSLIVARYVSKNHKPASLHYATGASVDTSDNTQRVLQDGDGIGAVIVASEPLTDCAGGWIEVSVNHFLLVADDLSVRLVEI